MSAVFVHIRELMLSVIVLLPLFVKLGVLDVYDASCPAFVQDVDEPLEL